MHAMAGDPVMADYHVCACRGCDPDRLDPSGPRLGEHHIAVRFGTDDALTTVRRNGELTDNVVEVLGGSPGQAWCFSKPLHRCRTCWDDVCEYVDVGNYSVSRVRYATVGKGH